MQNWAVRRSLRHSGIHIEDIAAVPLGEQAENPGRACKPASSQVELARVVDGSDKGAPTVRNTIRRLAEYILENKTAYVRGDPTLKKVNDTEGEIQKVGEELLQLAAEAQNRFVPYTEFEVLLKRLHDLGTYPTNRQVSDVAHAIHGEEITGLWQASGP